MYLRSVSTIFRFNFLTVWDFCGPYNILWVTSRSIKCHMTLSTMNYLLIIVQEETYFYIYLLSAFLTIGPNFFRYSGVGTKISSVSVKSFLKTFVKYKVMLICKRKKPKNLFPMQKYFYRIF